MGLFAAQLHPLDYSAIYADWRACWPYGTQAYRNAFALGN